MAKIADLYVELSLRAQGLNAGLKAADAQIKQTAKNWDATFAAAQGIGKGMMVAGGAIVAAIAMGTREAASQQQAMEVLNRTLGMTTGKLNEASSAVDTLSIATGKADTEIISAWTDIARMGIKASDTMRVLEASTRAAAATGSDVVTVGQAVAAVLRTWNLSASDATKVTDQMAYSTTQANMSMGQLGEALKDIAPSASILGVSYTDLLAAFMTMAQRGRDVESSVMGLSRALMSLSKPTDDVRAALKNYGYESGQALIASEGLLGVVKFITVAAGGSTEKMIMLTGGTKSFRAMAAIAEEGGTYLRKNLEALAAAGGTVATFLTDLAKTAGFQWDRFKKAVLEASEALGQPFLSIATAALTKLTALTDVTRKWTEAHHALTVAIGITGAAITALGAAAYGLSWLYGMLVRLRAVWMFLAANPLVLQIIVPVAAIAAIWRAVDAYMAFVEARRKAGVAREVQIAKAHLAKVPYPTTRDVSEWTPQQVQRVNDLTNAYNFLRRGIADAKKAQDGWVQVNRENVAVFNRLAASIGGTTYRTGDLRLSIERAQQALALVKERLHGGNEALNKLDATVVKTTPHLGGGGLAGAAGKAGEAVKTAAEKAMDWLGKLEQQYGFAKAIGDPALIQQTFNAMMAGYDHVRASADRLHLSDTALLDIRARIATATREWADEMQKMPEEANLLGAALYAGPVPAMIMLAAQAAAAGAAMSGLEDVKMPELGPTAEDKVRFAVFIDMWSEYLRKQKEAAKATDLAKRSVEALMQPIDELAIGWATGAVSADLLWDALKEIEPTIRAIGGPEAVAALERIKELFQGIVKVAVDANVPIEEMPQKLTAAQQAMKDLGEAGKRVLEQIRMDFEDAIFQLIKGTRSFGDFFKSVWDEILKFAIHVMVEIVLKSIILKNIGANLSAGGGEEGMGGAIEQGVGGAGLGNLWGTLSAALGGIAGIAAVGIMLGGLADVFGSEEAPPPVVTMRTVDTGAQGGANYPTQPTYLAGGGAAAGQNIPLTRTINLYGDVNVDAPIAVENFEESAVRRLASRLRDALEDQLGKKDATRGLAGAGV
jgi:TP901 family phage tail tape measure protein